MRAKTTRSFPFDDDEILNILVDILGLSSGCYRCRFFSSFPLIFLPFGSSSLIFSLAFLSLLSPLDSSLLVFFLSVLSSTYPLLSPLPLSESTFLFSYIHTQFSPIRRCAECSFLEFLRIW